MMEAAAGRRLSPASRFAVRFIETYRVKVSSGLRTACPFEPSCSAYGLEAYRRFGFWRATAKTVGRLARCRKGYEGPLSDPP